MTYKTPGVYIEEISLFPPSVAQVASAIPAFVGYTEKASDSSEKSLTNTPVRIKSLVEFQSLFGGGYVPASYAVVADGTKNNMLVAVTPDKRYYLFDALRQFYDNGGGYCYIVSVNSYTAPITFDDLKKGFDLLRKVDEPTLLLAPDAVGLLDGDDKPDLDKFTDLQKLLLTQCAELQDRFAILDILGGSLPEDVSNKPVTNFRDNIGINNLSYGAAYYPWIITSYSYEVVFRQLKLFDKADLDNAVGGYDSYAKDDSEKALVASVAASMANTDAALDVSGVQKTVLKTGGSSYLKATLAGYQADIDSDINIVDNITAYLNLLNAIAVCFTKAETAAQAGSGFKKEIEFMQKDSELTATLAFLVAVEKNPKTIANADPARDAAEVKTLYSPLETAWLSGATVDDIAADTTDFTNDRAGCLEIITTLGPKTTKILSGYQRILDAALHFEKEAGDALFAGHQFFHGVQDMIVKQMRTLPPSGATAGIYATVDNSRGVWKAPANVSINSIVGPSVKLDNRDQEDLNVSTTGKSINAIRAFTGKGTLVWGARTLAGNDNEWRYVPVRRFFIMVEESTKKATEPFVFEPNDANTWVKVRAMIENFLILQWRAGALQGQNRKRRSLSTSA